MARPAPYKKDRSERRISGRLTPSKNPSSRSANQGKSLPGPYAAGTTGPAQRSPCLLGSVSMTPMTSQFNAEHGPQGFPPSQQPAGQKRLGRGRMIEAVTVAILILTQKEGTVLLTTPLIGSELAGLATFGLQFAVHFVEIIDCKRD